MQIKNNKFINIFKDIFVKNNIEKKTIEQREQANLYLKSGFYAQYIEMINVGYIPTIKQKKIFDNYFTKLLNTAFFEDGYASRKENGYINAEHILKNINSFINSGLSLSPQHLVASLSNYNVWNLHNEDKNFQKILTNLLSVDKKNEINSTKLNGLLSFMSDNLSHPTYFQEVFNQLLDKTQSKQNKFLKKLEIYFTLQQLPVESFKNIEFKQFLNFSSLLQPIIAKTDDSIFEYYQYGDLYDNRKININIELSNKLNEIKDKVYKNIIHNQKNNTKQVYSYHEKLTQREEYNIKQVELDLLPNKVKDVLAEINSLEAVIGNYIESYSVEKKFELDNLFNKRIPEALNIYFEIMPQYRTQKMDNQKQSAQEILFDTLDNYYKKLETIVKNKQENTVSQLNILKRYSKNI